MESLILENFRCFAGHHEVPVRPLTLLVGENSSGKTNFLAAARIVEQLRIRLAQTKVLPTKPLQSLDFNEEPFKLGAFEELPNCRAGRSRRLRSFRLGGSFLRASETESICIYLSAKVVKQHGHAAVETLAIGHDDYEMTLDFSSATSPFLVTRTPSHPEGIKPMSERGLNQNHSAEEQGSVDFWTIFPFVISSIGHFQDPADVPEAEWKILGRIGRSLFWEWGRLPFASAPMRAQPKRTYEPLSDVFRPEGDHVPMFLAQTYGEKEWKELCKPLESFAKAAGLFDEIIVKRLGKSQGSPFQIHVKLGGSLRNLTDVGYGVSQILPLLVDLLRDKQPRMYLVQQPEVHLHPRAQAELGTLLATIAKNHVKQLLIETHSDYILDRIRMEVREGTIKPADIVILFFERVRGEVKIHPIEVDELGNLIDTPPSFGSFFLDEQARFLGVADVHHH